MAKLPLIVGLGGINAAGRSSGFHSYKRLVCDALQDDVMASTWQDLAQRMGLDSSDINADIIAQIKAGTLVRHATTFDPKAVPFQRKAKLTAGAEPITFQLKKSKLPHTIPANWSLTDIDNKTVTVTVEGDFDVLINDAIDYPVSSAGNIPTGFDLDKLYNSRSHPRGLKLTVYGASDALNSLGVDWDSILTLINPDEVSVYAGSALGQVDENSFGGMLSAYFKGGRVSTKMMAMALAEMPADFINSYVINSAGTTGTNMGACASFLYNLRQGMLDIQSGKSKVAIVGNAEAPVETGVMEGFRVMGALAEDDQLKALDNSDSVDNRRACRPFSSNAGFTMAESAQFVVLMDDELALELGVTIYGSVADVFINADANKKSISAPGIGNYVTVAKATALAKAILGEGGLQHTFVQAHGTGTPQNRVTESHILSEVAASFNITNWPVTAIKSYVGHSMGAAAGDQLVASLGVWQHGWIPGIKTIDHIADDVHQANLNILTDHQFVGDKGQEMKAVLLNAKGFGGNNATGLVLSPQQTLMMLKAKYGASVVNTYQEKNSQIQQTAATADRNACAGDENIRYAFGNAVIDEAGVNISTEEVRLQGFANAIKLAQSNPYQDYS
ncbi:beta-ketoacyl synthase [Moritella sp. F3]|uniref:beta-ketoacyl synthase n=1 Tax=Moritella sp. F3 TaxID=2718882 RepID=UPI0018E196A4|nr:beta-ketoacyl synthase [Moritella sp. F3]GIC78923.1 beta-ketoacyl-[acyl-carrier-protein] synthase FabY [Moritella sp. F1]GIC83982.1 beta-ketoacyl-[acyl-carrier-protein] synthase FabY [Moritella sp. F3]